MANEDKSARYQRLRRRASLLGTTWQVVFLLGLILTGGSTAIRRLVEALVGPGLVPVVAVYVCAVVALYETVHLPLAFYEGVVLERRYGLSTETTARWWAHSLKAVVISLGCVAAAALLVSLLLRWSPERWWLFAAVCFTGILVLLVQLAPLILLPRFYDVKPLAREALRQRLQALAERAGAPVLGVFEWRVGDRTRKANAALVGIGRTRRILVSDTLLAGHSDDEIEAVLAHELAHHVHGDMWSAIAIQAVLITLGFYVANAVITAHAVTFGFYGKADVAGLPLLALTGGAVSVVLMPMAHALSRAHERRADRYALDTTRNSAAFISAMRRLAALNMAEERPSRLVEFLFHTHPPIAARIDAAKAWALTARAR